MHNANMLLLFIGNTKHSSKHKCTNKEYHVQKNEYFEHQDGKLYFTTNQFPGLVFLSKTPKNMVHVD